MDATDIIAEQVRDAVRLRGLDPRMEPEPTRALIRDAIAAYDANSANKKQPKPLKSKYFVNGSKKLEAQLTALYRRFR